MASLHGHKEVGAPYPGRYVEEGVSYGPCLLVSREYGSGGVEVARRVGQRMGWHVFDREIVEEISRIAHERQRLIESVDEHALSYWDRTWQEVLTASDAFNEKYLRYLRQVVMSLGYHGEVIIIGRGAQYMLPPACAVRLRLVAPLELRAARLAEREGISPAQAKARILSFDAERSAFVRKTFKSSAESPHNYDLLLNTAEISFDGAAEIVIAALCEKLGVHAPEIIHASK